MKFLQSVGNEMPSAIIADIGCGNGKYLKVLPQNVYGIGIDFSENLIDIVQRRKLEGLVGDALVAPFGDDSFDAVISIAVLHHISTQCRRLEAIKELIRICKSYDPQSNVCGRILICAWALEQEDDSKHQFDKEDVFVPWALDKKYVTPQFWEKLNQNENENINSQTKECPSDQSNNNNTALPSMALIEDPLKNVITFQRYCHVYRKGELEHLLQTVAHVVNFPSDPNSHKLPKQFRVEVLRSFFNKGNWCVEIRKLDVIKKKKKKAQILKKIFDSKFLAIKHKC
ncbi:hypothetical protein RFI_29274 [Reticulomyxa filosa]|uniref:Methyltransferase type 11 domain-containing protein n=1 Tax=Reticulomyxa filosa TaxID=46433 RepID=X6M389_RETFI|nr:hypothetical protein RFI_29274 [Reticulomyxa filosa]|eukprot:ETO08116.1 hypothetical protein RFI_29274 [Reticulomyxa filosa]